LGLIWIPLYARDVHDDCFRKLLSLKCPVAMLDLTEDHQQPLYFCNKPGVRIFQQVRPKGGAGAPVTARLLQLGHRGVAFFSVEMAKDYARDRWTGISKVYKAAGCGHAVRRFSVGAHNEHEGDHQM
jgi:DNA-binding LacI/PurR family transcriptional regulator